MIVRNQKYNQDGFTFYRMRRGDLQVSVAITPNELAEHRDVVARRLMLARAKLAELRRWGLYR